MIAIVDYGVGNLFSIARSLAAVGADAEIVAKPETLAKADRIILPGVGAFGDAAQKLRDTGMEGAVLDAAKRGTPLLGICLGMQLLFEKSCEYGEHRGLGLIPGEVRPIFEGEAPLKIPHIGWNALHFPAKKHPLFKYIREGDCVYFVHSFAGKCCEASTIATTEYGCEVTAAVAKDNICGCQFHPEKSGEVGLSILRAFCETGGERAC